MSVSRRLNRARTAVLAAAVAACGLAAWLAGCTNDAFDPNTLENIPPVARIYVSAPVGGELNPTSYYDRTFSWSGTDVDGFVEAFYVSIETEEGMSAPWTETQRTDTTMTFSTDDLGQARALIRVACRDDRGAVSDTISRYLPLRNFPPQINFTTEYDTTFWSFSAANFALAAIDLDGNETMSDSVIYYLSSADSTLAPAIEGTVEADPNVRPVIKRIDNPGTGRFTIDLMDIADSGPLTLSVRVKDEADATGIFDWTWDVKPILSNVLLVDDFIGDLDRPFFYAAMDSIYGPDAWSLWSLADGLPSQIWTMLETFRRFDAVFWYTGATSSARLADAAPMLMEYLNVPTPDAPNAGKLLLFAKSLVGGSDALPPYFIQDALGVNRTASQPNFSIPQDKVCNPMPLGRLPVLHFNHSYSSSNGITLYGTESEAIYQMEEYMFWSPTRRRPWDPIVGVRKPGAASGESARTVAMTLQFEAVNFTDGLAALRALLETEMGVDLP